MSAAKGESPFGTCEWVSTRELAVVYGQTVDFWQTCEARAHLRPKEMDLAQGLT